MRQVKTRLRGGGRDKNKMKGKEMSLRLKKMRRNQARIRLEAKIINQANMVNIKTRVQSATLRL